MACRKQKRKMDANCAVIMGSKPERERARSRFLNPWEFYSGMAVQRAELANQVDVWSY